MQDLDIKTIKHVHFIGIGGIGISAIARMMKEEGKIVTGNDLEEFDMVASLRTMGINTTIGKDNSVIPEGVDLIVYSIAWTTLGPELLEYAKSLGVPVLKYPEMLGVVSKDKYTIAVSGTHGKTTTTGMIADILKDAGKDPTVVVGSLLKNGTNFVKGNSNLFVVESCEYRRSFLNINPNILVITNVDEDHLDYYKDIEDIKSAFRELAMKVPEDGYVVCNIDDKNIKDVVTGINAKVINYQDFFNANLKLKIPGLHNKKNAACAFAVSSILAISYTDINKSLMEFSGTWRRFDHKGTLKSGAMIYDDYAHHPKEIKATLQGFREFYPKADGWAITVIFQPHLFSRTKLLIADFATSFAEADAVVILPIYHAREEDDGTISSHILAEHINKEGTDAHAFYDFESAEKYLELFLPKMNNKDIIVTMGAGEAYKVGDKILKDDTM